MKRLGCGVIAVVLMMVLLVVVILGEDEDDKCLPQGSSRAAGGVPAGEVSLPQEAAMEHTTSEFGPRWGTMHQGIDIAQGQGTPIFAYADGVVAAAGPATGFGQWIVIDHNIDGQVLSTVYGHMMDDGVHVTVGDKVTAGQHIADEGYNGQVEPPGPGGSHLHFEVWEGGRLSGGTAVNPRPYLERAVEPGSGDSGSAEGATPPAQTDAAETPEGMEQLQPSPKFTEDNLQVNSVRLGRAVAMNFPEVDTIGGWRPSDPFPDHPSGRAIDVMIPNYQTDSGRDLGDRVTEYILGNWDTFDVDYIIWRQQLIYPDSASMMEERGDPTQNHFDHVHVSLNESAMATPGQPIGPGPVGGSASKATPGQVDEDCLPKRGEGEIDLALNAESIPPEWVRPIQIAGGTCSAVSAPLVAALLEQESGFSTSAVSHAGATGPAQFMPGTWASAGAEMSEDGEIIGPPGSGDINDTKDAIPAAGRYLCGIAERQAPLIASGAIKGDPVELMLAGYNAGEGAVQNYGGVPPFAETQHYVKTIPDKSTKYQEM